VRVGLISDIHGNRIALDAVLAELRRDAPDLIVCLGDVAVGPQPRESLDAIRGLGCPVVLGNWDAAFIDGAVPAATNDTAAIVNEIHGWWSDLIDDDDRAFLRSFVPQLELDLDGVRALAFHGSPRSCDDWIFSTTPDDELEPMFEPDRPPLLLGGHTHVQLARRWHQSLIVNPGSIGLPFLDWWPKEVRVAPWAEYAVVTADRGSLQVDLRRAPFDVDAHLALARASGMPHAEWWIDCWLVEARAAGLAH
jgi:predicted phosphodiesterase